jgi:rhodanese-related sulfurtransferase
MKEISRDEVKSWLDSAREVKIVEVLPEESFNEYHLPGAINVPVGRDFEEDIQRAIPEKDTPVIVYCANTECPASAKAAEKMDALGYADVLDYVAGKEDWKAAGFPVES